MLQLVTGTNVVIWLMAAIGVLGILAKIINQFTLNRLLKAAGNMPKSTHRLIKLVRAKYEHAVMIHDSVENIDAFVEKYIYEYRGCLFRIHTWRQIETLSIWFSGILAAFGASAYYLSSGFSESVYQYIAGGAAEMILLAVVRSLSDEPYKIRAVKMYMVDYLDNICAFRLKRQRTSDRDFIDVIAAENSGKQAFQPAYQGSAGVVAGASRENASRENAPRENASREAYQASQENFGQMTERTAAMQQGTMQQNTAREGERNSSQSSGRGIFRRGAQKQESELPINIEGEPRNVEKAGNESQNVQRPVPDQNIRRPAGNQEEDDDRPVLREEAIRQILEEFLA